MNEFVREIRTSTLNKYTKKINDKEATDPKKEIKKIRLNWRSF